MKTFFFTHVLRIELLRIKIFQSSLTTLVVFKVNMRSVYRAVAFSLSGYFERNT